MAAIINSFVSIEISLTNLILELIIEKNCYSQTSLGSNNNKQTAVIT